MRTSNIRKDIEIVTQKSSNRKALSPTKILSYGISTFKGTHCLLNTHHIGIHLGNLKHFMLLQGYDGMYASNYLKK